ncbi:MAG: ABC transporter permease, partial [Saprospiraceae bacterium]
MKYYFLLQYRMLQRHMREFGLAPIVGYLLASLIFVGASALPYFKLATTAPYIYIFLALSVINSLGKTQRNDFLKANFSKRDYYRLRWLENTILALSFMLFLCYQGDFIFAAVLFLAASLLSLVNSNRQMSFVIPTPFYRYPFEFTVGFRQTFPLHLFAYFLCFMSVWVGNFNLGIFAL